MDDGNKCWHSHGNVFGIDLCSYINWEIQFNQINTELFEGSESALK